MLRITASGLDFTARLEEDAAPDTVAAFLKPQIADSGTNYLVGQMAFGDLTLGEMLRSVELFGAHVMPALRAA